MKYGQEFSDGILVSVITDNLPAPLALVEKNSSNCEKECQITDAGVLKMILFAP